MNHIAIVESLGHLMQAVEHLEQFVDRVESNSVAVPSEEKIQAAKVMPSLRDVLRLTPPQIQAFTDRVHEAVNRLESDLYDA